MYRPDSHKRNSRIARTEDGPTESLAVSSVVRTAFAPSQAGITGVFGLRRCVIANGLLLLAIVCRLGFSDSSGVRCDTQAISAAPNLVEPARADWIGDLIDVLGGGGGDDDDDVDDDDDPKP